MNLKAIFPANRTNPVASVSLDLLKQTVAKVDHVDWNNSGNWVETIPAKDFARRLERMPAGAEVVVMGGRNAAQRRSAVDTSLLHQDGDCRLTLATNFML